jgi:hypothetical protein
VRLGGSNFRGHLLDFNLVLFGFILQGLKEFLVVSVGHGERRGMEEGEWVHRKKGEK